MLQIIKQWEPGKVFWVFWTLVAVAVSVAYTAMTYYFIDAIANNTGSKQVFACLFIGVAVAGLIASWVITVETAYQYSKVPPAELRYTLGDVIFFCRCRIRAGYRFRKWIESPSGSLVWYGFFLLWWVTIAIGGVNSYLSAQSTKISPLWAWFLLIAFTGIWVLVSLWFVALNVREFIRALVRFVIDVTDKHREEKARDPKNKMRQAFNELRLLLDDDECDEECDCDCDGEHHDRYDTPSPSPSEDIHEALRTCPTGMERTQPTDHSDIHFIFLKEDVV